jgi:outer membrane lipoprotein-sorting protein
MHKARRLVVAASIALLLLAVRAAIAAPATSEEKERERVLRRLDEAAKNFHSTSADFEFDSVTTDPIYEKDVQTGTVYYERTGKDFRMAAHIREDNKKRIEKVYTFSQGVFKLFEGGNINQVTTYSQVSKYESYLMLGFGASGKDLEEKWEIKYLGSETLDGVKTEKLELAAKDPAVRKNIPKVTVWMDAERGISLKQVFDEGPGQYRVSVYFNIKVNQPLPADAFTFKTDSKTQQVTR